MSTLFMRRLEFEVLQDDWLLLQGPYQIDWALFC
jgi:hypothetical protein